MVIKTEKLSSTDLTAINKLTFTELAEEDVFTFSAQIIDDEPTANGRVWSIPWQRNAVENHLFDGVPMLLDHENKAENKVATIFEAKQTDNRIMGKAFVSLKTERGQQRKTEIQTAELKSVSINASASNTKREGKLTRILPSKDDRVFEVSFVGIGGCKDCEVVSTETLHKCQSEEESATSEQVSNQWSEFGKASHDEASADYIRVAGLLFAESFNRAAYEKVAASLDPGSLKGLTCNLRKLYDRVGETEETTGTKAAQVTEHLNRIKAMKGI